MSSILVVGGGKMGLSHIAILNRLLEPGQVAVVDPSRLTRFVFGQLGIPTFASLTAALEKNPKWQGAVVASPTVSHYPVAKALLQRGIPCFIEKPLTLNPALSEELVGLQRQYGVATQMGMVLRFLQPFVQLREICRSGALGQPKSYTARMLGNVVNKPDTGGWRTDFKRGGGCLNEYGPHLIDLCRAVFGDVVEIDQAKFGKRFSVRADDSAVIQWRHADGALGHLELDWCDATRRKSYTDFTVEFEYGQVHANVAEFQVKSHDPSLSIDGLLASYVKPTSPFPVNFYLRGEEFTLQLEVFLERAMGRRLLRASIQSDSAATLEDGLAVDKLIQQAAAIGGLQ